MHEHHTCRSTRCHPDGVATPKSRQHQALQRLRYPPHTALRAPMPRYRGSLGCSPAPTGRGIVQGRASCSPANVWRILRSLLGSAHRRARRGRSLRMTIDWMRAGALVRFCGALALAGCRPDAPQDGATTGGAAGMLRTDSREYTARAHPLGITFQIVARYENRTAGPVYLGRCTSRSPIPIYYIHAVNGDEVVGQWACVGTEPIRVEGGEVRIDTLRINRPEGLWRLVPAPRFILRYEAGSCPDIISCPLPDSARVSKPFTVRLPA